ncbi:MAG: hypothetical protein Q8L29_04045 [archaeon]|nr:hypothetical protein [archaeon]
MSKLKETLAKYLLGTDFSDYYNTQRAFYSEFIIDSEELQAKRERINREELDMKILSVWIPNISYVWGIVALVSGNPGFLMMNAGGESLRWIARYLNNATIKRSDEIFRKDQIFIQEMRESLPELKAKNFDACSLEASLTNLKRTLDSI